MKILIKLIKQMFNFGIVGILCFAIDYGLMVFFTDFCNINYLLSCAMAFIISTIVNYVLSMRFVFKSANDMRKRTEFIFFVAMSSFGLVLTEILMLLFVEKIGIHYMLSKIAVTAMVMVYNFVTRKLVFEKRSCFHNER